MVFRRKLTDDQVRDIRRSREPARLLAQRHGVTHPTILNVREGRTYKHVRHEPFLPALDWSPGEYHVCDAMEFLTRLPNGACPTVVVSPPRYEEWTAGERVRRRCNPGAFPPGLRKLAAEHPRRVLKGRRRPGHSLLPPQVPLRRTAPGCRKQSRGGLSTAQGYHLESWPDAPYAGRQEIRADTA